MVSLISHYTNKRMSLLNYNGSQNEKYCLRKERMFKVDVTVDEIYAYIGLLLLFGLTRKTDISVDELWCEKSIHYVPIASITMSRDRFQLICRNICFDDIETRKQREHNKFFKMDEIFNEFKSNLTLIVPSYHLCVDEELYGFRGRCSFRQFIPSKPARYGIKYWCLTDVKSGNEKFSLIKLTLIFI